MTMKFAKTMLMCAAIGVSGASFAQGAADWKMNQEVLNWTSMDANKDGMVSKAEFMKMMEKSYDMGLKKMSIKGDKMTEAQYKEFLDGAFGRKGG